MTEYGTVHSILHHPSETLLRFHHAIRFLRGYKIKMGYCLRRLSWFSLSTWIFADMENILSDLICFYFHVSKVFPFKICEGECPGPTLRNYF